MLDGVKKDGFPVTDVYRNSFKEAELTFLHQRVYDITTQQLLHLTDLPSSLIIDDISYLGGYPFYMDNCI
jgi:exonuclease-1